MMPFLARPGFTCEFSLRGVVGERCRVAADGPGGGLSTTAPSSIDPKSSVIERRVGRRGLGGRADRVSMVNRFHCKFFPNPLPQAVDLLRGLPVWSKLGHRKAGTKRILMVVPLDDKG
jgi:hypothetical protein